MICLREVLTGTKAPQYRVNKITKIIISHLKAGFPTSMIVNVNPAADDFDETRNVLSYATTAQDVKIRANEHDKKQPSLAKGGVTEEKMTLSQKSPSAAVATAPSTLAKVTHDARIQSGISKIKNDEVKRLKEEIENLKQNTESLKQSHREEIENLKKNTKNVQSKHDDERQNLRSIIRDLKDERDGYIGSQAVLEHEIELFKEEVNESQEVHIRELSDLKTELTQLLQTTKKAVAQCQILSEQLGAREKEVGKLQTKLSQLQMSTQDEIEELLNTISVQEEDIETLKSKLENEIREKGSKQDKIEKLTSLLKNSKKKLAYERSNHENDLQTKLEKLKDRKQKEIQGLQYQFEVKEEKFSSKISKLREQLQECKTEASNSEHQFVQATEQLKKTKVALLKVQSQKSKLQRALRILLDDDVPAANLDGTRTLEDTRETRQEVLPQGWRTETTVRKTGKSAGRFDTYYYSPNQSIKFRSMKGVQMFIGILNLEGVDGDEEKAHMLFKKKFKSADDMN